MMFFINFSKINVFAFYFGIHFSNRGFVIPFYFAPLRFYLYFISVLTTFIRLSTNLSTLRSHFMAILVLK